MRTALIVSILAMLAAVALMPAGAQEPYRGDYIDEERRANRQAIRSHNCTWFGVDCPRRWGYLPRIPKPDGELMEAQRRLRALGYELEDDGLMGPETREAISDFQRRNGLEVTGGLGPRTLAMLHQWSNADDKQDAWREDGRNRDCKPREHGIGRETYNMAEAQGTAQSNWMDRVKFKYGIRYADPVYAKRPRFFCPRSGAGLRKGEKFVAIIPFNIGKKLAGGNHLTQCMVWADPCAAEDIPVVDDDRADIGAAEKDADVKPPRRRD